jgi:hypothetical protein
MSVVDSPRSSGIIIRINDIFIDPQINEFDIRKYNFRVFLISKPSSNQ